MQFRDRMEVGSSPYFYARNVSKVRRSCLRYGPAPRRRGPKPREFSDSRI